MGVILVYKPTNITGGPHPVPSGNLLQFAIEAMAIEIVDLPRKKTCFAIVMLVYQRVIIPYNSLSLL